MPLPSQIVGKMRLRRGQRNDAVDEVLAVGWVPPIDGVAAIAREIGAVHVLQRRMSSIMNVWAYPQSRCYSR